MRCGLRARCARRALHRLRSHHRGDRRMERRDCRTAVRDTCLVAEADGAARRRTAGHAVIVIPPPSSGSSCPPKAIAAGDDAAAVVVADRRDGFKVAPLRAVRAGGWRDCSGERGLVVPWVAVELAPSVTSRTSVSIRPEPSREGSAGSFVRVGRTISLFAGFVAARVA